MSQTRNLAIAAGALVLALAGGGVLWWSAQTPEVEFRTVDDDPLTDVGRSRRAEDGLVRSPGAPAPTARDIRDARRRRPQLRPGQDDTGDPSRTQDDTGLTGDNAREVAIQQIMDDVAQDTGLNDEQRDEMLDALDETLFNAAEGTEAP